MTRPAAAAGSRAGCTAIRPRLVALPPGAPAAAMGAGVAVERGRAAEDGTDRTQQGMHA